MSSNTFSSDLVPDSASRRAVIGSSLVAMLGGLAVIASLPFGWPWRVAMATAWVAVIGRDLWSIANGYRHCSRIRIGHTGELLVFDSRDCCEPATLDTGSVVLGGFAWLRFRTESGRRHAELLRRKTAQDKDWRHLRVIWRYLGAGA